ncbi:AMP-binding protein, partial [Streptomyces rochei]
GAMCEHSGLLNHLHAKIEDLGIGEGTVVAQTASQCFDISLWQLLAGLVTGGRTLLVEQEAVLDADRFLDAITDGQVNILQLVPSYLDVLLTALERTPRDLPDLRCVSVTGEVLRTELVRRWFRDGPGVRLVNAYGLTETSDDTNHEVMDAMPTTDRIPLG